MGCHFLLQGIFPTQRSNPGLPHCRWTPYHLSHQGSPGKERDKLKKGMPIKKSWGLLGLKFPSLSNGEGNGTPLQYSYLENPVDGGAWWAAVHRVAGSRTVTSLSLFTFTHWRRKWQPTPVFLAGESQGWGSLVGFRLWGCTESDKTEAT